MFAKHIPTFFMRLKSEVRDRSSFYNGSWIICTYTRLLVLSTYIHFLLLASKYHRRKIILFFEKKEEKITDRLTYDVSKRAAAAVTGGGHKSRLLFVVRIFPRWMWYNCYCGKEMETTKIWETCKWVTSQCTSKGNDANKIAGKWRSPSICGQVDKNTILKANFFKTDIAANIWSVSCWHFEFWYHIFSWLLLPNFLAE